MNWVLLILTYASTDTAIPPNVMPYEVPFASEALCEAAREKVAAELPTRDVKIRTTCLQVAE